MFLVDGRLKSGAGWPTLAIAVVLVSNAVAVAVAMCFFSYFLSSVHSTEPTEKLSKIANNDILCALRVAESRLS
jgi:hypothetical protein